MRRERREDALNHRRGDQGARSVVDEHLCDIHIRERLKAAPDRLGPRGPAGHQAHVFKAFGQIGGKIGIVHMMHHDEGLDMRAKGRHGMIEHTGGPEGVPLFWQIATSAGSATGCDDECGAMCHVHRDNLWRAGLQSADFDPQDD